MSENTDKRTASQRLEDLEKVVTVLYQSLTQHKNAVEVLLKSQGDMGLVKEALKLLNKKLEATIQVAKPESGITVSSVNELVVKMNVEELKAQTAEHVANGMLSATDTVADNSFLVCEELNQDGTVANPRVQFRLDSQTEEVGNSFKGKKVGDTISFGENKFSATILELYSIVEPKPADAASAETPAVQEPTETAPTATTPAEATPDTTAPATEAPSVPSPAPTGPSNEALAPPAETPVTQFVSDAGSVASTATS
jgi:hypothetical protein